MYLLSSDNNWFSLLNFQQDGPTPHLLNETIQVEIWKVWSTIHNQFLKDEILPEIGELESEIFQNTIRN